MGILCVPSTFLVDFHGEQTSDKMVWGNASYLTARNTPITLLFSTLSTYPRTCHLCEPTSNCSRSQPASPSQTYLPANPLPCEMERRGDTNKPNQLCPTHMYLTWTQSRCYWRQELHPAFLRHSGGKTSYTDASAKISCWSDWIPVAV